MSCQLVGSDLKWQQKNSSFRFTSVSGKHFVMRLHEQFSQAEIVPWHGHIFATISYGCHGSNRHIIWRSNANLFECIRTEKKNKITQFIANACHANEAIWRANPSMSRIYSTTSLRELIKCGNTVNVLMLSRCSRISWFNASMKPLTAHLVVVYTIAWPHG